MTLRSRLEKLPHNPPMIVYLGVLLLLGLWRPSVGTLSPITLHPLADWVQFLARVGVVLGFYSSLDLVLGYVRVRRLLVPTSAWVSGLILALVLPPQAPWTIVLAAPLLASLSKHLLRYQRRHVFNPAAFALVSLALLAPRPGAVISWWGSSWGPLATAVIAVSGLVTIVRVQRWKTWLAFATLTLAGRTGLILLRGGTSAEIASLVTDGTFWFFSTVMLIEPVTTAYTPASVRTWYGAGVGALVILLSLPRSLEVPDPFLVSLLLGNLGATIARRSSRR